ncbi:hypothetical protein [uncultured Psychrosphaera sp.]|uniref:hypothetical protein n=1 Tax=uncultured Psychrosphaera sp. TaxID=1403522 RepID=UPI0026233706|nr:hypothetical protein [uncultured Psychrosphaera sp.]
MRDCLIKFSREKSHLVDFVENGRIYVNTAVFFSECENDATGQFDKFEMASSYHQHEGASIEIAGRKFKIAAPFCMQEGSPEYSHIFCLYVLSEESISRATEGKVFDERLWDEFGEYFVLIHNAKAFIERLDSKLRELKLNYKADYVQYFCPKTHEGDVGAFRKRDTFSHQEEYRVAIDKPDIQRPIDDMYLGDLSEIAYGPVHKSLSKNSYDNGQVVL